MGEQFGVRFVVVVDVSELFGSAFLAARMINVQTGLITATADKNKEINGMEDLTKLSEDVAKALFGKSKENKPVPSSEHYVKLEFYGLMIMKKDLGMDIPWRSAQDVCEQSRLGGFSDWRLPTQAELSILYNERNTIGGFNTSKWYWSSTTFGSYYGKLYFSNGEQCKNCEAPSNCRCVRNY